MFETFFGFRKTPFADSPTLNNCCSTRHWNKPAKDQQSTNSQDEKTNDPAESTALRHPPPDPNKFHRTCGAMWHKATLASCPHIPYHYGNAVAGPVPPPCPEDSTACRSV